MQCTTIDNTKRIFFKSSLRLVNFFHLLETERVVSMPLFSLQSNGLELQIVSLSTMYLLIVHFK